MCWAHTAPRRAAGMATARRGSRCGVGAVTDLHRAACNTAPWSDLPLLPQPSPGKGGSFGVPVVHAGFGWEGCWCRFCHGHHSWQGPGCSCEGLTAPKQRCLHRQCPGHKGEDGEGRSWCLWLPGPWAAPCWLRSLPPPPALPAGTRGFIQTIRRKCGCNEK